MKRPLNNLTRTSGARAIEDQEHLQLTRNSVSPGKSKQDAGMRDPRSGVSAAIVCEEHPWRKNQGSSDELNHPLECGFYWVDYRGEKEIMFRGIDESDSNQGARWYRAMQSEAVAESQIEFVYPGRLREPTVRMDYSIEEDFEEGEESQKCSGDKRTIHEACCDCGSEYPFEGLDLFFPDEQWKIIFPDHGGSGVLCPKCITKRVAALPQATVIKARFEIVEALPARRIYATPPVSMESGSDHEL